MRKNILILFLFIISVLSTKAQQAYSISGTVKDEYTGKVIENASVSIHASRSGIMSDSLGRYELCHLQPRHYALDINHMGYHNKMMDVVIENDSVVLDIYLTPSDVSLNEVVVDGYQSGRIIKCPPVFYSRNAVWDKPVSALSKMLDIIPGATTINIGAGVAKPVIRGLSGNRVAVINKGITQQNQQWGADHGMEINQFDMDYANVYKGPNALLLGSGSTTALDIFPIGFKGDANAFKGEAILWGASNNDQAAAALTAQWQNDNWFVRGVYSHQDYADYRVPAHQFNYEGHDIAIPNKRLPNTAGKEQSLSATLGYKKRNVTSYISLTNNYQKNGLLELEDEHDEHDEHDVHDSEPADTSHRNIGMPYATSNHMSVTNNTEWKTSALRLLVNTGYQRNHRQERSPFHPHYDGQTAPEGNDDTEVDFTLDTYSSNARLYIDENKTWRKTIGASIEYQQNRVGGYEFFLPRYNQLSGGLSFVGGYKASEKLMLEAGARYDLARTNITGFYDQELAQHLQQEGHSPAIVDQYARRAYDVDRTLGSYSGSVGANYRPSNHLLLKMNIGKSFRLPSANELASNGAHHAAFRYEIGNPNLKPEHGYSLDLDMRLDNHAQLVLDVSPFLTYYTNFIYLQSVDDAPVVLYEEQPYHYTQAKALFGGGEYQAMWRFMSNWELSSAGSIVLNKNLDDHNPLPFTPPFTMRNELKYSKIAYNKKLEYYQFSASHQWYASQNRVGVGEAPTEGVNLFNIGAGVDYRFSRKWIVRLNLQVQNIFDTQYLNHMSLYRRLNIPEPGRNIQLFVRVPFGK